MSGTQPAEPALNEILTADAVRLYEACSGFDFLKVESSGILQDEEATRRLMEQLPEELRNTEELRAVVS